MDKQSKNDSNNITSPQRELSSPTEEAVKTFTSSIVGIVPVVGPIISSTLAAAIQAENTKNLNAVIRSLEEEIQKLRVPVQVLLKDPLFRGGVSQLYLSVFKQEPRKKLDRIRNFIRHRIRKSGEGDVISDAVLRAFEVLPAAHIEEFLTLLADTDADLYDFSIILGDDEFDLRKLVRTSISTDEDQDYCDSPADIRWKELNVLFRSLDNAGLVRLIAPLENSDPPKGPVYQTTELAKAFVSYCLDPSVDYEAQLQGENST